MCRNTRALSRKLIIMHLDGLSAPYWLPNMIRTRVKNERCYQPWKGLGLDGKPSHTCTVTVIPQVPILTEHNRHGIVKKNLQLYLNIKAWCWWRPRKEDRKREEKPRKAGLRKRTDEHRLSRLLIKTFVILKTTLSLTTRNYPYPYEI